MISTPTKLRSGLVSAQVLRGNISLALTHGLERPLKMSEKRDPRVRELVYELVDATPAAPNFNELNSASAPRLRPALRGAAIAVVVTALIVAGVTLTSRSTSSHGRSPGVRVGNRSSHASTLRYPDLSKPPPIRVSADGSFVDVTTVLGCWFHSPADAAGHGAGVCADGAVDPSQSHLEVAAKARVEIELPISGDVSASIGDAQGAPPPHSLASPVEHRRELALQHVSTTTWSFTLPSAADYSLLIDIKVDAAVGASRVSGDAHYGVTLLHR